jgi:hypothetical protein
VTDTCLYNLLLSTTHKTLSKNPSIHKIFWETVYFVISLAKITGSNKDNFVPINSPTLNASLFALIHSRESLYFLTRFLQTHLFCSHDLFPQELFEEELELFE